MGREAADTQTRGFILMVSDRQKKRTCQGLGGLEKGKTLEKEGGALAMGGVLKTGGHTMSFVR